MNYSTPTVLPTHINENFTVNTSQFVNENFTVNASQFFNDSLWNVTIGPTESATKAYNTYYEVARWLQIIIRPILIVFGTIGNSLAFVIMRRGSLKKVSTCFYMAILAIADTMFLWSGAFAAWFRNVTYYKINPFTWLDCKFLTFVAPFSSQWSSSLLVIMCVEKFCALYFPLKTRSICNVHIAKRVTLVATILCAGLNMQSFFIFDRKEYLGEMHCFFVNVPVNYFITYNRIEHTVYSFGPFTVMGLANCAIIYKFMRASCLASQEGTSSTNQALSKSANKGTAMLITVSLAFIILTGPVAITLAITNTPDPLLQAIIVLMRYVNHAINAVLYCMSGTRFRRELMKIFPFSLCNNKQGLQGSRSFSSSVVNSATAATDVSTTGSPI